MKKIGWIKRARILLAAVAMGGVPLITVGSCDPLSGAFDFYRDDDYRDGFFFDDGYYYYDDYYYDDCFDCYYEDEFIFFP